MLSRRRPTFVLVALLAASVGVNAKSMPRQHLVKTNTKGDLVYYSGRVTLSGTIERRTDDDSTEMIGDQVCMFPEKGSAKVIPRGADDSRDPWFCFSNRIAAMKQLQVPNQKPKGACGYRLKATVQVTDYVVNLAESEVFDTARLIQVVSRGAPRSLSCNE
ncbi:MAG: hypothetical protein ACK4FE_04060 [Azonexus sp.]